MYRNDSDKLAEFLSTVKEWKKKIEDETPTPNVEKNKDALYADLLGVTVPDKVIIKTPKVKFRNKGSRRIKSAVEQGKGKKIARTNRKVPFKWRTCSICHQKGHNKVTCPERNIEDVDEVASDEDEGVDEDEFYDEHEVDEEDESEEE